jgi:hypothetical protein
MSNSSSAAKCVSKVSKKPRRVFLKPVPNFQTCCLQRIHLYQAFSQFLAFKQLCPSEVDAQVMTSIRADLKNKSPLICRDPFTDHYFKIFMLNPDELIALTESALDFDDLDDSKIFDANCKKLVDLKYVFTELNNYYFRTRKFKLEESVRLLDSDE